MSLAAETKVDAIRELVGILASAGLVSDASEAERVVMQREAVMSTGMEQGVAIPHGKTDTVDRLVAAVAIKPGGIDFDCADGEPARILIITLSPASRPGPHLRFMAEASRLLHDARVRERVLTAQSRNELVTVLTGSR